MGRQTSRNDLWASDSPAEWSRALAGYEETITRQGVEGLSEADRWVREELPTLLAARPKPHVSLDELVRVTRWKMARGIWRARNLALVQGNSPASVVEISGEALAAIPDPKEPIARLAKLKGVGPATASAVIAAAAPDIYPFFDELVANQIPDLGPVAFTSSYYQRYSEALRARAERLDRGWSPADVERALWSHVGGKAGVRAHKS